jgi:hypothetical protein
LALALGVLAAVVMVTVAATTAVARDGRGSGVAHEAAQRLCRAQRISCDGYWTTRGAERVYVLSGDEHLNVTRQSLNGLPTEVPPTEMPTPAGGSASPAVTSPIENQGTNTCITSNGTPKNGEPAQLFECNGSPNQDWKKQFDERGNEQIYNVGDKKCLNNKNGTEENKNPIIMWTCYNSYNEALGTTADEGSGVIVDQNNAHWVLSSLGDKSDHAPLYLYEFEAGHPNQLWNSPALFE